MNEGCSVSNDSNFLSFHLPEAFIAEYAKTKPAWGFDIGGGNSLSELTYIAKYSRKKEDGTKERWYETCERCINGMYSILKDHCKYQRTPWNEFKAQKSAQDAFDRMFNFKWTPPGRGLATMGTQFVHEEQNNASLNNCAFISTEKLSTHSAYEATMPFVRLMEMSMHGVGVGFDTRGAGKLTIHEPGYETEVFVVQDDRESWCESLGKLLESYFFKNRNTVVFDYSLVRPAGAPLKRFGGTASGPEPLTKLHESVRAQLRERAGQKITSRDIVDIMNKAGKAVVAGGARRSALIALGDPTDSDYVNIKNWELPENAERTGPDGWAWTSNNSVFAKSDTDLDHLVDKIVINGEPGIIYIDTMQNYGRLADPANNRDYRAIGVNPCAEISLEPHEFCCLSELYPANHETLADFQKSIKHAYMYAKAVTLMPSIWPETNEVITRNRRIGVSMTGIAEFIESRSWHEMKEWMDKGYGFLTELDRSYSEWLGVRESIKVSTVKPAGTTSIIAGTTSGVHWPTTSGYYIRRQRFLKHDPIVAALIEAGYDVEPDVNDPEQTVVASFPTTGPRIRSEREVSVWEKAHLAALAQRYWADNMVSVTVSFDQQRESDQVAPLLRSLEGQLKSVSFLPISSTGTTYKQAPFEPLDSGLAVKQQLDKRPLDMNKLYRSADAVDAVGEKFCNNDSCEISF
jgi:ribonucleoside-triphosphate reductase